MEHLRYFFMNADVNAYVFVFLGCRQSVRPCSSGQHFYSSGLALCVSVSIHREYFS